MSSRLEDQAIGEGAGVVANYDGDTSLSQLELEDLDFSQATTGAGKSIQNDELKDLNFELKAIVGFALPPGNIDNISPRLRTAVYNSFVTLNLTPTVHEFDVDDMGRCLLYTSPSPRDS